MKFIHVTDPHLVAPGRLLFGLDPLARLQACIADVNARHGDAHCCVITGDLAHCGEPAAYLALREAVARLSMPCCLLLGNHDDRANFRRALAQTPCDEAGFAQSVLDTPAGHFVFLDTHEPGDSGGRYCARRCAWLRACLARLGDRPAYLFMHHPPFQVGIPFLDRINLRDAEPFAAALAGFDNVRHLFLGHMHRPVSGSWRGIPFSTLRGTSHQVPLDFANVQSVAYVGEPAAYAVVFLDAHQTVVHSHDYLVEPRRLGRP